MGFWPKLRESDLFKNLRYNEGTNFALADTLLFAQIPNLFVALPAALVIAFISLRSIAGSKTTAFLKLEKIERPFVNAFQKAHGKIPFIKRINPEEFGRKKPGSTLLVVGMAQVPVFIASLIIAAINPLHAAGWLAALAIGFFTGSNIRFGLQINDPERRIRTEKTWRDVLTSPQVLVAAGSCTSGLMAGLASSFGVWAIAPIVLALGSAAMVCTGKLGKVTLNKGLPMAALSATAGLNAAVGLVNGQFLSAFTNLFSSNGARILAQIFHHNYREKRPNAPTPDLWRALARDVCYHEEQLHPAPTPVAQAQQPVAGIMRPYADQPRVYHVHPHARLHVTKPHACVRTGMTGMKTRSPEALDL